MCFLLPLQTQSLPAAEMGTVGSKVSLAMPPLSPALLFSLVQPHLGQSEREVCAEREIPVSKENEARSFSLESGVEQIRFQHFTYQPLGANKIFAPK